MQGKSQDSSACGGQDWVNSLMSWLANAQPVPNIELIQQNRQCYLTFLFARGRRWVQIYLNWKVSPFWIRLFFTLNCPNYHAPPRHGIPELLLSDNGPQFLSSVFAKFAEEYSFTHITSSPRYPQSNQEVERAVQTVKSLLKKSKDPYWSLMTYRATPWVVPALHNCWWAEKFALWSPLFHHY